ncbi:MAG: 1-aminocyclopropane-1-carboxylate deaminase/D-cysteine desulfhydrase, partial [Bacteroidota bacterium]
FIKRDDFIGQLVWGNKLRKLEYSLADALEQGADTIITCGAVQSNHARITAQVCKRMGIRCILVQNGDVPAIPHGNHKVNLMLGVEMQFVSTRQERNARMQEIHRTLEKEGRQPYIIPLGASNATGCLGFVNAVKELKQQQVEMGIQFDYILHSTSSGGTQAGLEIGKRLFGLDKTRIIGVSADNTREQIIEHVLDCTQPVLEHLDASFSIDSREIITETGFVGPGYGLPSEQSAKALERFAREEGILLDNTYTAKAAAALLHYLDENKLDAGSNILFWHTGGIVAEL